MLAYKGFGLGLIAHGDYRFKTGIVNECSAAECRRSGFHCAENPLDVFNYFHDTERSEYWIVDAGGDIHELGTGDSALCCTRMVLVKRISPAELIIRGVQYMLLHPSRPVSYVVREQSAYASGAYCVVKGRNPCGGGRRCGDIVALVRENEYGVPLDASVFAVDGVNIRPGRLYDFRLAEVAEDGGGL